MRFSLIMCIALLVSGTFARHTAAQTTPVQGDPPVASLISVSAPDEEGIVTITGSAGAVFPAAQVTIRNLYTQQTIYANANITGAITARIYGPGNTPFWISPAASIPTSLRDKPGSLPGGPGTIIYGSATEPSTQSSPVTRLRIDGDLADWETYPQADLAGEIYALTNADSLYVALDHAVPEGLELVLALSSDGAMYELALDPALAQAALLRQTAPAERDLGALAVTAAIGETNDSIELRIPLGGFDQPAETIRLDAVLFRTGGEVFEEVTLALPIANYEERDGIVYPGGRMTGALTRFEIAGPLAQGASTWRAQGRIDSLDVNPGERLTVELDTTLNVPELPPSLVGLKLIGEIGLQPVAIGPAGEQSVAALHTNNGWSNLMTPSGLAVDNVRGDLSLGTVTVPAAQVLRRGDQLLAGFRFALEIPPDLPPGLYVPTFAGRAQIGDGQVFDWEDNGVFGQGPGIARQPLTRLPLVLSVGGVEQARLAWTLFYDHPSDGSRGILPDEDRGRVALSNRVRFNSPTYILPPGDYPLEPYLLNQMSNAYDVNVTPLLPLLFPGGRLKATVILPDGTVDELPDMPVVQNRLSTQALDERDQFGAQSPLDVYRLTTLNPAYTAYPFDQYGEYEIRLTGVIEDTHGHRYMGGGTYHVVIAEPLDLTPGMLPGTPLEVGDVFFAGGRVAPGMPAVVNATVTVHELENGEIAERRFGPVEADRHGYFAFNDEVFRFEAPGEYVIDYEARFTDQQGRLWAASLRGAGVIASPDASLLARGQRGLADYVVTRPEDYRPSWLTTAVYPPQALATVQPRPNYPYHPGDVAVAQDSPEGGIRPVIHIQDVEGAYRDWLLGTISDYRSPFGLKLERLAAVDELPLLYVLAGPQSDYGPALLPDFAVNEAYAYISAVRPGVTVRQLVIGGDDPALAWHWDGDDPFNGQIGAGVDGNRPGDYTFLFGGAVVRNAEAGIKEALPYAALAVTGPADEAASVYPPYRGAAGGPVGDPLFVMRGEPTDLFFHPTGARPGQVMKAGDVLTIAGQVAPPLPSEVDVTITSPDGVNYASSGVTNAIGYYYDPAHDLTLDEAGVWTVRVLVRPAGSTSAGVVEPPLPVGGVPGTIEGRFPIYVLPDGDTMPLAWSRGGDIDADFRPGVPFNLGIDVPPEWTNPQAFYTVSTPSYVLESGSLRVVGQTISHQFNPVGLAREFPNLEYEGRGEGPAASDVVTLTFAITGTDADGNFAIRTRTLTLLHDRLVTFEETGSE